MEIEKPLKNNGAVSIKNVFDRNNLEIIREIPFNNFYTQKKYNLYHAQVH